MAEPTNQPAASGPDQDQALRSLIRDRARIPTGPFRDVPFDLEHLHHHADGTLRSRDLIARDATTWLLLALRDADVDIDDYDHEVAQVIAEEGTTLVQVVAGWITRAHHDRAGPTD